MVVVLAYNRLEESENTVHQAFPVITLAIVLLPTHASEAAEIGAASRAPRSANRVPGAVFIPTPHDVVAAMLELAAVRPDDVVYDLGCGDGRIVIAAAQQYGCRAVGIDIDPLRVEDSRANVQRHDLAQRVRIEHQDARQADLRSATVVTLYLTPRLNAQLIAQLEKLPPGARIVAHESALPGIAPQQAIQVPSQEDGRRHALYLWTTPLRERATMPGAGAR